MGIDQQAKEYKLLDRFELEDVTVVGSEEGQLKYGFEILSSRKSFAVYSGSLSCHSFSLFYSRTDGVIGEQTLSTARWPGSMQ